jgi:hypothetical protein
MICRANDGAECRYGEPEVGGAAFPFIEEAVTNSEPPIMWLQNRFAEVEDTVDCDAGLYEWLDEFVVGIAKWQGSRGSDDLVIDFREYEHASRGRRVLAEVPLFVCPVSVVEIGELAEDPDAELRDLGDVGLDVRPGHRPDRRRTLHVLAGYSQFGGVISRFQALAISLINERSSVTTTPSARAMSTRSARIDFSRGLPSWPPST